MKLNVDRREGGKVVISLQGQVDADTSPQLRDLLEEVASEGPQIVVVDLADVDFMDSSGLSALVTGFKGLSEEGAEFVLTRPRPQALKALKLTQLDHVFPILDSVEEALNPKDSG